MFTVSEQPNTDMWNHLKFLGKKNNCIKLLNGEIQSNRPTFSINESDLEKKANQISMCINQASEYFLAANQVSINTSPLLYFYGMLSLAKALIVANKQEVFLENINYHGLHSRPINEELKAYKQNSNDWSMENEFAITNDGVFKHLTETLDDFSFPNRSIITFKKVFSICPEISAMYTKYYGKPPNVLPLYEHEETLSPYSISLFPRELDEKKIYESMPELEMDFELSDEILHQQARKFISREMTGFPDYMSIYEAIVGGKYIVGGVQYQYNENNKKISLNQASTDYIGMFILSNCVRYKPDFWGSIIEGNNSGVLGLIELYINVIKRRYPNIILDNLFGEQFRYGTPSYLI